MHFLAVQYIQELAQSIVLDNVCCFIAMHTTSNFLSAIKRKDITYLLSHAFPFYN